MDIVKSIEIMKTLSDSSRLRLLNALMAKPQYVEEIANRLNLAVSTVSFHLKKLEKVGLVSKTKEQYYITYSITPDLLKLTLRELTCFENIEQFVEEERLDKYRNKVLKSFMKEGRITRLPVQHKKKKILLDEIVKLFGTKIKFTEKEVDDIIHSTFDDHCTIRRLLIEEGIMKRDGQNYWLTQK